MGLKLLDSGAGPEPRAALSASFKAAAAHMRSLAGGTPQRVRDTSESSVRNTNTNQTLNSLVTSASTWGSGRERVDGWVEMGLTWRQKQHRESEMGGVCYHRMEVNRCIN